MSANSNTPPSQLTTHDSVETWKLAHRFVLDTYRLSARMPAQEQQGLVPKLRGAAVKVASNIVEGHARKDKTANTWHLNESQSALEEAKYTLLVARDLGYISEHSYATIMNDAEGIAERLGGLQSQLAAKLADSAAAPTELPAESNARPQLDRPAAFGQKKGVKETWSDLIGWFKGNQSRQVQHERYDNVWTEETPVTSYLEDSDGQTKL